MQSAPLTLYDKIWQAHLVEPGADGTALLYIDRHLLHEITSPQAFEGLRQAGRPVRRPETVLAVVDHNVPTRDRDQGIADAQSALQIDLMARNCAEFGIEYWSMADIRQGIVHIIGPEHGFTLPGSTVVCGDSHTATHGAFGALAFGIGTSEVEHVLATQTLPSQKSRNMRLTVSGRLAGGVTAKDLVLAIIGRIGTAGGTGHVIEYAGAAIRGLSMEERMTVCNMSIEAGARAGLIAPDAVTFDYLQGRPMAPKGALWEAALADCQTLRSDDGARFDSEITIDAGAVAPQVTWGTSPEQVIPITGHIPDPRDSDDPAAAEAITRALDYMGLKSGSPIAGLAVDRVFIGSCTNSRIGDLRAAAAIARGRRVKEGVGAMVVPGSGLIRAQAQAEGLDRIFLDAGFEWRQPGCSMCLGMNPDRLLPGERCASTSNRNFEGRQGRGGRTHLLSPAMAAAAAITGCLTDVRALGEGPA